MRQAMVTAATSIALFAAPAAAMTAGQASCPVEKAPSGLAAKLVEETLTIREGQEADPVLSTALLQIDSVCAAREKVPTEQQDDYTKYIIARLKHDEMARQLAAMKVPVAVLESVFDIGPGKRNPTPQQVTEAQFNIMVAELAKDGVSIDQLPDRALGMMGAYVTVTGDMYRAQAAIR